MDSLRLSLFPAQILQKKAERVISVGDPERILMASMATTMYLNSGVGLAAVQVGIDKQIAVIDVGSGLIKMVNPDIVKCEGSVCEEEGCLSVPGVIIKVKRAGKVTVNFLNEKGEPAQIKAGGLLARAIQHEVDHLHGILILDHANPIKKALLKTKLRRKGAKAKKT